MSRIGFGYDVHAFTNNRKLILGGVYIPFEKGLAGHSDADVLAHAVIDALLGAATLGDTGTLFPNSDSKYKNANSIELLSVVGKLLMQKSFSVGNIDSTIVIQEPVIKSFIPKMKQNISIVLGINLSQVSVKATTTEHLGVIGRGEGVAAYAVAMLL